MVVVLCAVVVVVATVVDTALVVVGTVVEVEVEVVGAGREVVDVTSSVVVLARRMLLAGLFPPAHPANNAAAVTASAPRPNHELME